jgi:hypothetical protein
LTSKYPFWSPYSFSGNQVIHSVELEGLETSYNLNFGEGTVSTNGDVITVAQLALIKKYKGTVLSATPNGNSDGYNKYDGTIRLTLRLKTPSPDLYNDFKYTSVVVIMDANEIILRNHQSTSRGIVLQNNTYANIDGVRTLISSTVISPHNYSSNDKDRALNLSYSQVETTSKEISSTIPNSMITKVIISYNGLYLTNKEIAKYRSEVEEKYKDSDVKVEFREGGTNSNSIFKVTIEYAIKTPAIEQVNDEKVTPLYDGTNGTQNKDK